MLKDFKPRLYQETILASASLKNTLVVLPTGLGKTAIALLLSIQRLKNYPKSKIIFLAPTKPLVEQHRETFEKHLDINKEELIVFTGAIKPEKRVQLWEKSRIIFSTPQSLENDIISEKISLKDVSLIIFDEAHRATGDYAYNFIARQYIKNASYPRILALTASPGSNAEKIEEICKNLFIEEIEVRTKEDPDVKPYVQKTDFIWESVELPEEFLRIRKNLNECFTSKLNELNELGILNNNKNISKKELLLLQKNIQSRIAKGEKDFDLMRGLSISAEAIKVQHAIELLETQSVESLVNYLKGIFSNAETSKIKAVQNLVRDTHFKSAFAIALRLNEENKEHPKIEKLKSIVNEEVNKGNKIIIFNNYRENALKIIEELKKINVKAVLFIGQQKKNGIGLSQKEQKEIIEKFRIGDYNVMVATSIGEEGLDIPKVDSVIFYEPIPSAIRQIQRRGRTGRSERGKVIILYTKNSRDEIYKWSAYYKEKKMNSVLKNIKNTLSIKNACKECLNDFIEKSISIVADYREKGNSVIKELIENGVKVELKHLETADYILSGRIGVEYKTQKDFVDSIIDGRLLSQLKMLKDNFEKPIIVVEGSGDLFSQRNIHPNSIRGMIATIIISYSIPLIFTRDSKETAALFISISKREGVIKDFSLHTKKPISLREQQEYLVSSLPNVGPALAKALLEKFGSVKNIVNASEEELLKVEGVGEKIAKKIKEITDKEYVTNLKDYLLN
ncbi:MAG: DEAD/DEAH box helicase [Candidatus Woesearchaeota archaeon]